jgi:hypothetical protein
LWAACVKAGRRKRKTRRTFASSRARATGQRPLRSHASFHPAHTQQIPEDDITPVTGLPTLEDLHAAAPSEEELKVR